MTNSLLLTIAIEIVDLPIKDGDFPQLCKRLPEGNGPKVGWSFHFSEANHKFYQVF